MRIIKPGKLMNFQTSCTECGCVFEYDNSDIQIAYGVMGNDSYVQCPCCNYRIYIFHSYNTYAPNDFPFSKSPTVNFKQEDK